MTEGVSYTLSTSKGFLITISRILDLQMKDKITLCNVLRRKANIAILRGMRIHIVYPVICLDDAQGKTKCPITLTRSTRESRPE